jgi:hypothetical protein
LFSTIDLDAVFERAFNGKIGQDNIIGHVNAGDAACPQVINIAFGVKDFWHKHILYGFGRGGRPMLLRNYL